MEYFKHRQNPFTDVPESELDGIFKDFITVFDRDWLEEEGDHPLRVLWKRKDSLASKELAIIASSTSLLHRKNALWVNQVAQKIKQGDPNTRKGFMFELVGLGFIDGPDVEVFPAVDNNPGYDGTVTVYDKHNINLSLKCYGLSNHNLTFQKHSKSVESSLIELMMSTRQNKRGFIINSNCYPSDDDWKLLINGASNLLRSNPMFSGRLEIGGKWLFHSSFLTEPNLSDEYISYSLAIVCPYHNNEYKILYDKMDDACYNIIEQCGNPSGNNTNVLYMHIPITQSIPLCIDWSKEYFSSHPSSPIAAILFYQPGVATEPKSSSTNLTHYFANVFSPEYDRWLSESGCKNLTIPLNVFCGKRIDTPTELLITNGTHTMNLDGHYVYQKGKYYTLLQKDHQGRLTGNIEQRASGIFTFPVAQPFPDQASFAVGGHFPPSDELILFE